MKKIYLLITAIIFSVNVNAQTPDWLWAGATGGGASDGANYVTTDPNGNVYTTGIFAGTPDFDPGAGVFTIASTDTNTIDVFVCKTDSGGNFIWAKAFGGVDVEAGRSIAFDPSGNGAIYISGNFRLQADFDPGAGVYNLSSVTHGYSDGFICKLDTAGNFIWARSMGGSEDDIISSITVDPAGSGAIYCMGAFRDTVDFDPTAGVYNLISAGMSDIFVSKYDSSGNLIWAKGMGGPINDYGTYISRCPAGSTDVYTTGVFAQQGDFDPGAGTFFMLATGQDDIFISKLDSAGNFIWAKNLGGRYSESSTTIASDVSGNVYTSGRFKDTADFDPGAGINNLMSAGGDDFFVSKIDSSGNFVWAKGFGGISYDTGNDLVVDASGDIYLTGGFTDTVDFDPGASVINLVSVGNIDIFVLKLDNSGNFVWAKQAGGTNGDNSRSLAMDTSGSLYIAGAFSSSTVSFAPNSILNTSVGQSDIFVAKLGRSLSTGIGTVSGNALSISVFPNPFTNDLIVTVLISNGIESGRINVLDLSGRLVYTQKLKSANTELSSTNWPQGVYFVEIVTDEGKTVKKVIKQ